jgi:hypothetical protein
MELEALIAPYLDGTGGNDQLAVVADWLQDREDPRLARLRRLLNLWQELPKFDIVRKITQEIPEGEERTPGEALFVCACIRFCPTGRASVLSHISSDAWKIRTLEMWACGLLPRPWEQTLPSRELITYQSRKQTLLLLLRTANFREAATTIPRFAARTRVLTAQWWVRTLWKDLPTLAPEFFSHPTFPHQRDMI